MQLVRISCQEAGAWKCFPNMPGNGSQAIRDACRDADPLAGCLAGAAGDWDQNWDGTLAGGICLLTQDFWWERGKKGPAKVPIRGTVLPFESLSLHVYSLIPKVCFKDVQQVRTSTMWWKGDKWETDDSWLYNLLFSPHKERAVQFSASYPVMFYRAKWRAVIQTTLPFYQPILPPHRPSREAEFSLLNYLH